MAFTPSSSHGISQETADALYIADSLFDAKGDIIAASAADTAARVAVGADGTVLTASAAAASGVAWAAAAGGLFNAYAYLRDRAPTTNRTSSPTLGFMVASRSREPRRSRYSIRLKRRRRPSVSASPLTTASSRFTPKCGSTARRRL